MQDEWQFCVKCLEGVSRSFSLPISMLEGDVRKSVTCAYLLCRIVDTIEDDRALSQERRDSLFRAFLAFLHDKISEVAWAHEVAPLEGSESERELAHGMAQVLCVLKELPINMQEACKRWVQEMCMGMQLYSVRPKGVDGIRALIDLNDLNRYCYFVAGTVGHLLTELFLLEHPDLLQEAAPILERHAEAFGVALQLVNILKDLAKDRASGYSFIPRSLGVFNCQPELAHERLQPLFHLAYTSLDDAMQYVFAVSSELRSIRLFLLIPLLMAVATLKLAEGNDAIFQTGSRIAISRNEVESLVQAALAYAQDDHALKELYAALIQGVDALEAVGNDLNLSRV